MERPSSDFQQRGGAFSYAGSNSIPTQLQNGQLFERKKKEEEKGWTINSGYRREDGGGGGEGASFLGN